MCGDDPDSTVHAAAGAPGAPQREQACVRLELTEREARALIRATTLVADVLRPELLAHGPTAVQSPLVTAYQVLIGACERAGVDVGLVAPSARDSSQF